MTQFIIAFVMGIVCTQFGIWFGKRQGSDAGYKQGLEDGMKLVLEQNRKRAKEQDEFFRKLLDGNDRRGLTNPEDEIRKRTNG